MPDPTAFLTHSQNVIDAATEEPWRVVPRGSSARGSEVRLWSDPEATTIITEWASYASDSGIQARPEDLTAIAHMRNTYQALLDVAKAAADVLDGLITEVIDARLGYIDCKVDRNDVDALRNALTKLPAHETPHGQEQP